MKEKFRREKLSGDEGKELLAKIDHPECAANSREMYMAFYMRAKSVKSVKNTELTEEFAPYGRMYSF